MVNAAVQPTPSPAPRHDPGRLIRPEDPGTSEDVWSQWLRTVPVVNPPSGRVLVVAPHPDDETLGAGGLIATMSAVGNDVVVVVCSDGEAASERIGLASVRTGEFRCALAELADGAHIAAHHLSLPDGGLSVNRHELRARLAEHVNMADLVVAPWIHDGHPDHRATAEVLIELASDHGCEVWSYPIWAWHWGTPPLFEGLELCSVELAPPARVRKRKAMWCHRSQIASPDEGVLTADVRRHFLRPVETFVVGTDDR